MPGNISVVNLNHTFKIGKLDVPVLHQINFTIEQGDFVALCGASGSGKSTLLNIIGGLTKPTSGTVVIDGHELTKFNENKLCLFRQKNMGFIFQSYNLLANLTALENVELTLVFAGMNPKKRRAIAMEMLELVGLKDRMKHKPNELSGGQQQRVSIARALVNKPAIVLADEPTGNLDSRTGAEIWEIMRKINAQEKCTFVMVTHDTKLAKKCDRIIYLKDGYIVPAGEVIA